MEEGTTSSLCYRITAFLLLTTTKKKNAVNIHNFDFCSSIAHILHNSFRFRRPFCFPPHPPVASVI